MKTEPPLAMSDRSNPRPLDPEPVAPINPNKDEPMSKHSIPTRAEGRREEFEGTVKKNIGDLIGNEQMALEGQAKELEGQAHQATAKALERAKGAAEELAGTVKKNIGDLIDNEQMQVEGKLGEIKGKLRQGANQ